MPLAPATLRPSRINLLPKRSALRTSTKQKPDSKMSEGLWKMLKIAPPVSRRSGRPDFPFRASPVFPDGAARFMRPVCSASCTGRDQSINTRVVATTDLAPCFRSLGAAGRGAGSSAVPGALGASRGPASVNPSHPAGPNRHMRNQLASGSRLYFLHLLRTISTSLPPATRTTTADDTVPPVTVAETIKACRPL